LAPLSVNFQMSPVSTWNTWRFSVAPMMDWTD
jgi:hypothetical protein